MRLALFEGAEGAYNIFEALMVIFAGPLGSPKQTGKGCA